LHNYYCFKPNGLSVGAQRVDHNHKGLEHRQTAPRECACSTGSGTWVRSICWWGRATFI